MNFPLIFAYEINSAIPIPPPSRGGLPKYPFPRMSIGDSFFVAGKTEKHVAPCIRNFRSKHGGTFACRRVVERGTKGVRVWRTA